MTAAERHIYAAGNTARGYRTLYESVLADMDRVYLLTGVVEGITSALIEKMGKELQTQTDQVEWIHSPFMNGQFDGIVLPKQRVAIMDHSYPRVWRPKGPGLTEIHVNLQTALIPDRLAPHKEQIARWYEEIFRYNQQAYEAYGEALRIHDDWEGIYIGNLDREKANQITEELKQQFFGSDSLSKTSRVRRMYLGAATPAGPVDHIMKLTDHLEKRYFIKGRPGSGKSTMLKKLVSEAERKGFDVEVYHCGLDPNSLDMVIFPEKSVAIFDSTAPHEYFPNKETDEVIDMYTLAITPGTDERFSEEIEKIKTRYAKKVKEATGYLVEAKNRREQLNAVYLQAVDQTRLHAVGQAITSVLIRDH